MGLSDIQARKAALRRTIQQLVQAIDPAITARDSARVCGRLRHLDLWRNARVVLFYAPLPHEVNIWPLLEEAITAGKLAALPYYQKDQREYQARRVKDLTQDLKAGWAGIREPADHCGPMALKELDLVLVPGVAFDRWGRRLGRGKGFYDRLLSLVCGTKCGVGWDIQLCLEVPAEPHDVKLDCILTPTQWLVAGHESV
jgi:5-formyltetrahydrofolate cyclo-ligase